MKFKDMFIAKLTKFIDSEMEAQADEAESEKADSDTSAEIAREIISIANKSDECCTGTVDSTLHTTFPLESLIVIVLLI